MALTGTNHAEDQPVHLRVRRYEQGIKDAGHEAKGPSAEKWTENKDIRREHVKVNVGEYAGLLGRACPAQVYEYVEDEASASGKEDGEGWGGKKLVINSQVRLPSLA